MPITKSAKKALRQSRRRREFNSIRKKELKDALKKIKKGLKPEDLSLVFKKLDKAAKKNLIRRGRADRLKSRLTQLITKSSKAVS